MNDLINLQNLHDIIQPPPTPLLPPAPGWYVVGFVSGAALIWLSVTCYMRLKRNTYRREAIAMLNGIENTLRNSPDERDILFKIPELVKRTAMSAYGRTMTASLTGSDWLEFLDKTMKKTGFTTGPGRLLTTIAYESQDKLNTLPDSDISNLLTTVRTWITKHDRKQNYESSISDGVKG